MKNDNNIKKTLNRINLQRNLAFYEKVKQLQKKEIKEESISETKQRISPESLYRFSSIMKRNNIKK